jgi:hypothetical protein
LQDTGAVGSGRVAPVNHTQSRMIKMEIINTVIVLVEFAIALWQLVSHFLK